MPTVSARWLPKTALALVKSPPNGGWVTNRMVGAAAAPAHAHAAAVSVEAQQPA
ncbi:MAG: hypothetical protein U0802_15090 [Candidatus Binatia bacterium]